MRKATPLILREDPGPLGAYCFVKFPLAGNVRLLPFQPRA
jgi:hypothetical protein